MVVRKILFIPDCHHPYVDKRAWRLLLKVGADVEFNTIVQLGDFIDFDSVSSHARNTIRDIPTLRDELAAGNEALDELDSLEAQQKYYIFGNHENRFDRFICQHGALRNLTSIEHELHLKKRGWQQVDYRKELKIGKLFLTHDCDNAGETAHSQALKKAGASIIIGHTHRVGYAVRGNLRGSPQLGAMFGWLGDRNSIEYKSHASTRHEWALGFGVGLQAEDGVVHVTPCPIINYTVAVFGKIYK
jgi:predicted phosphodiesterase